MFALLAMPAVASGSILAGAVAAAVAADPTDGGMKPSGFAKFAHMAGGIRDKQNGNIRPNESFYLNSAETNARVTGGSGGNQNGFRRPDESFYRSIANWDDCAVTPKTCTARTAPVV
eukprot:Tamp_25228.p1 GENE.Tamp_25228~~Tamp_25228.p1  ORF type:complete len:117 (-),score=28.81 Tamp_25228:540-890(-)